MRTAPHVFRSSWWEIVRVFLTLGALSPSGPGLTGILQTEVEETRGWLSQARFVEGMGLVNLLPGPSRAHVLPALERGAWITAAISAVIMGMTAVGLLKVLPTAVAGLVPRGAGPRACGRYSRVARGSCPADGGGSHSWGSGMALGCWV